MSIVARSHNRRSSNGGRRARSVNARNALKPFTADNLVAFSHSGRAIATPDTTIAIAAQ